MQLKFYRSNSSDLNVAAKMNRDVYHARRYVRDGDWVFDIGANVGAFCLFVKEFCKGANVVCVEPMPSNLEALNLNVGDQASIEAAAISSHSKAVTMYDFGLANSGCHSIYNLGVSGAQPVVVQGITLRNLFDKYDVSRLRFLKLDCQGSEYDVIPNAGPDLLNQVDVVAMEVHHTIGPDEVILGTIPNQSEKARRMYESLKQTHVLVCGSLDAVDTEQIWENRRGMKSSM
jgi:FkbM family methyltransferase